MNISTLKADERAANDAWLQFQALNSAKDFKDNGVEFKRKEITEHENQQVEPGSFEIRYTRVIDGIRKGKVVFRFLKNKNWNTVQWDEKFITI